MPKTVTRRGVELTRTGTWAASTGVTTITRADLEDMVAASRDPELAGAPIVIGHRDPRFDGDPAYGWVENLSTECQGDECTLVGDLVGIPQGLADIMPAAFRRRSVEIAWGVRTRGGARYRAALAGLALLGVQAPAVSGLADVVALYTAGGDRPPADRTCSAFMADGCDLEAAQALRASWTSATELAFRSEAPPEALSRALDALDALAAGDNPPPSPARVQNGAEGSTSEEGEVTEAQMRELLGIERNADITAAVQDLRTRAEAAPAEPTPAPAPEGTAPAPSEPTPAPAEPELVTLSAGNYQELTEQARAGAEARSILRTQEIDTTLRSALSAGRIAPRDVEAWRGRLDRDYAGTTELLESLTPAFPTSELGSADPGSPTGQVDDAAWGSFMHETFGLDPEPAGK